MVGVGGATVAGKFGIDRRAAGKGVGEFFENEHGGAFANDEAVAGSVKRAGGVLRGLVRGSCEGAGTLEAGEG